MPPSRNTSYAEREKHRKEFYQKHKNIKRPKKKGDSGFLSYSKGKAKFVAPLALVTFVFAILFSLAWVLTTSSRNVANTRIPSGHHSLGSLGQLKGGKIYMFKIRQNFEAPDIPQYSELEIEIVDEHNGHVYSVYKDLWEEMHPNEDGYSRLYNDTKIEFELEIEKKGNYFVRAISHNGNLGSLSCTVDSRSLGGHLYYGLYAIIFLALSVGVFLGRDSWGDPAKLMNALPSIKELKTNKLFLWYAGASLFIFIMCIIIGATHYGYASAGEVNIAPSTFYSSGEVIYIG